MKFTIARRVVQLAILGLFIAGNIYGGAKATTTSHIGVTGTSNVNINGNYIRTAHHNDIPDQGIDKA